MTPPDNATAHAPAPLQRFVDKVVLITGGSRGIGKALATRFAGEGANLVLSANEPAVEDAAEELRATGVSVLAVQCDVTSKADVARLYDRAIEEFGQLDVSIQNAGTIHIAKLEDL